jgi:hypothetical protein
MLKTSVRIAYSPTSGAIVYDSDIKKFYVWTGDEWNVINPWTLEKDIVTEGGNMILPISMAKTITIEGTLIIHKDEPDNSKKVVIDNFGNITATGNITSNGNIQVNSPSVFEGFGTVPVGGIIMWSGDPADLPDGWKLCEGGKYTNWKGIESDIPDLRGRFVVSYGTNSNPDSREQDNSNYLIDSKGGINKYYLNEHESAFVRHVHTLTGSTLAGGGAHGHTIKIRNGTGDDGAFPETGDNVDAITYSNTAIESGGSHIHSLTGTTDPILDKITFIAEYAHENRPAYYVLAFIIRTK